MALGDGIRRNFAKITQAERDRFVAAVKKMHDVLTFSDGVSYFHKNEETHELAHPIPHDPTIFLAWHRELINRFETMLRVADPDLSLHYWDWTEDPRNASDGLGGHINLMNSANMGDDGSAGINQVPATGGGDVGTPFANFESECPDPPTCDPSTPDPQAGVPTKDRLVDFPGHGVIWRNVTPGAPPVSPDNTIVAAANYQALVSTGPPNSPLNTSHNEVHEWFGGTLSIEHLAASDPFFFLLHSNMDRIFALWQLQPGHEERLDGSTVYGTLGGSGPANADMVPWNGSLGIIPWVAGNTEPTGGIDAKTPKDPSVVTPACYDTNPPQISVADVPGTVINFNDVPEGETTVRAAVFDCQVCKEPIHFTAGTPTGPYSVLVGSATVDPHGGTQQARIWLSFTGTTAGTDAPAGSVTVHCTETGQDFDFTIQGNTIARPTVAVELVLDQSGSMDWDAGTSGLKRIDVLKPAALRFADVIQGGNAAGLVRFDHLAYGPGDPTFPGLAVTNIVSDSAFDVGRINLRNAVLAHATNPMGNTSIGAGVQLGRSELNLVSGFDKKAMIVFTDGQENTPPMIADVMGLIDSDCFAIGLGDASQVSTAALFALCNNHKGYVLITDNLSGSIDDFFLVSKYFLQVLAGVQNNEIVVDPAGKILPGQTISVPFQLSDADIQATALLVTDIPAIHMRLRTPAGDLIDPVVAAAVGAEYIVGQSTVFYRFGLPVALGAGAQSGTWNAVLEIDPAIVKRCKETDGYLLASSIEGQHPSVCDGVRYMVQVHAWSNLRMTARVLQTSLEPGATMTVRAVLTEYDMPVDHRATTTAAVTRPDGTQFNLALPEVEPGVFEVDTKAFLPGVYKFLVTASGKTWRGVPFSRQQLLTGAVFYGGDDPLPTSPEPGIGDALCDLLSCLLKDPGMMRLLKEKGLDPGVLLRCCEQRETPEPLELVRGITVAAVRSIAPSLRMPLKSPMPTEPRAPSQPETPPEPPPSKREPKRKPTDQQYRDES